MIDKIIARVKNINTLDRKSSDGHTDRFVPPMILLIGKDIKVVKLNNSWYYYKKMNCFFHRFWLNFNHK